MLRVANHPPFRRVRRCRLRHHEVWPLPVQHCRDGVRVRGLRTIYGPLTFSAKGNVVNVSGVSVPPGGIVLMLPGREVTVIRSVPASIVF